MLHSCSIFLSLSLSLSLCISMADFDAPSFFLGLDFDADLPQSAPQSPTHATTSRHSPSYNDGNDAVLVKTLVPDPLFPFLKRDLFLPPPSALGSRWELPRDVGDSPKEMPSREDPQRDKDSVMQSYSACSSSNLSFHSQRQSTQSADAFKHKKNRAESIASTSGHLKTGSSHWISPKSTIRPPRSSLFHSDNLWEDFSSKKKEKLDTPAFDDFCGAYIRPVKDFSVCQGMKEDVGVSSVTLPSNCLSNETRFRLHGNNGQEDADCCGKLSNSLPPAYQYFFHNNLRIQRLVRDRFRYFFPLGHVSEGGNQQSETSVIDYVRQFDQREMPIQVNRSEMRPMKESSKGKRKLNNVNAQVSPQASGSWVNPKSSAFSVKDTGKFGLHMEGHSPGSGHWYTGHDGTKVYVTKTGHELTGQIAYRKYRKESDVGIKMSRKKAANQKSSNKTAAKKSVSKASNTKRSNKTTAKKSVSRANTKKSSCKPASKKRTNQGSTSNKPAKKKRL